MRRFNIVLCVAVFVLFGLIAHVYANPVGLFNKNNIYYGIDKEGNPIKYLAIDATKWTSNSKYFIIEESELKPVLDNAELVRVEDTHLSDFIRLIKYNGNLFIQETTFNKEIIVRKVCSIEDADKFIQERLDFYERKWDGCGCKIDYYE